MTLLKILLKILLVVVVVLVFWMLDGTDDFDSLE